LYDELRRIAARHLGRERPNHTLQPTELVHEAYVRLVDSTRCEWKDRTHFLAVASRAMRRILVDHARSRSREKRWGGLQKVSLDEALLLAADDAHAIVLEMDIALDKLARERPEPARVVEMHFFGGLTHKECAEAMGISPRTVSRYWEFAQAWLYREIAAGPEPA
jgi:RNA polymerase sigma factor (TIGR02999 family)